MDGGSTDGGVSIPLHGLNYNYLKLVHQDRMTSLSVIQWYPEKCTKEIVSQTVPSLSFCLTCFYKVAPMVEAVYTHGVKLLISTAGGAGPQTHVDFLTEIISDLINRKKYSLKVATIYSDVSKETVLKKLAEGKIHPCGEIDNLRKEDVERSDAIVCQIGHEPFLKALKEEPDIIIVCFSFSP